VDEVVREVVVVDAAGLMRVVFVVKSEPGLEEVVELDGLMVVLAGAVGPFVGAWLVLLGDG